MFICLLSFFVFSLNLFAGCVLIMGEITSKLRGSSFSTYLMPVIIREKEHSVSLLILILCLLFRFFRRISSPLVFLLRDKSALNYEVPFSFLGSCYILYTHLLTVPSSLSVIQAERNVFHFKFSSLCSFNNRLIYSWIKSLDYVIEDLVILYSSQR